MKELTTKKLRRMLRKGTTFTAEFLGPSRFLSTPTKRLVIENTPTELVSRILEGPRENYSVYMDWAYTKAVQYEDRIELLNTRAAYDSPFVKITNIQTLEKEKQ